MRRVLDAGLAVEIGAEDATRADRSFLADLAAFSAENGAAAFNVADTLGFVYRRKGLAEPALQQARYAIQLAEEAGQPQAVFQYHLGLALRSLGRNDEAVAAFQQALSIDPNFPDAGEAKKELEAARTAQQAAPSAS